MISGKAVHRTRPSDPLDICKKCLVGSQPRQEHRGRPRSERAQRLACHSCTRRAKKTEFCPTCASGRRSEHCSCAIVSFASAEDAHRDMKRPRSRRGLQQNMSADWRRLRIFCVLSRLCPGAKRLSKCRSLPAAGFGGHSIRARTLRKRRTSTRKMTSTAQFQ